MKSESGQAPPSSRRQWVRTIRQREPIVTEEDRYQRHVWSLADLSTSDTGCRIVVAGDSGLSLWEIGEGQAKRIASHGGIPIEYCLADPAKGTIITLSNLDRAVHIWDAHSLFRSTPIRVAEDIRDIYLCGSGVGAAIDNHDVIRLFSTENGRILQEFSADTRRTDSLAYRRIFCQMRFLVRTYCERITIWDIKSGTVCKELILPDSAWLGDCISLHEGKVAAIDLEGTVYIWNVNEDTYQEMPPKYRDADGWLGQLISLPAPSPAGFAAAAWGPGEEGCLSLFDAEGCLVDVIQLDDAPTAIAAVAGGAIAVGYGDGWELYEWV